MARLPKGVLPALALAGLGFAVWSALSVAKALPPAPAVAPPRAPYPNTLAGSGILEPAAARTTAIGAPYAGLIVEVAVEAGAEVAAGEPLFRMDDRSLAAAAVPLEAAVVVAEAGVRVAAAQATAKDAAVTVAGAARDAAQARLDRLRSLPRPEDLPPLEARVDEARALVADLEAQLERLEGVRAAAPGSVVTDDWDRRRFALTAAKAARGRAQADLALAKAGAWAPDLAEAAAALAEAEGQVAASHAARAQAGADVERAQADVLRAQAAVRQNALERERAVVRAPTAATVLDVLVRAGEVASSNREALVVLGDVKTLLVRVDVDEESAPLVRAGGRAQAVVRGFPDKPVDLTFLRIEPYVKPKKSLTGATSERVDTRVLQVLYRAGVSSVPLYVGQQVDVFLEGLAR